MRIIHIAKAAIAAGAIALASAPAVAAGENNAGGAQGEEAAPAGSRQPGKRRPKKGAVYQHWAQAEQMAKAWDQPVVAIIEIDGDKAASKIRMKTFGAREFAEFTDANFVFYHCKIPQKVEKTRRGRRVPVKKDAPLKPDYDQLKKEDSVIVSRINGTTRAPAYPILAVISPEGGVKYSMPLQESEVTLTKFYEELKSVFEENKWPLETTKKFQKALDADAKAKAALEKQRKK